MYSYQDNSGAAPATALTAIGQSCRHHLDGWDATPLGMVDGVAGLMKNGPIGRGEVKSMYYSYATQAVHCDEDEEWKNWNEGPKGAEPGRLRTGTAASAVLSASRAGPQV
jgi:hypothetical protein